ncbi:MAG: hypothetical protein QUS33_12885 [Dehalococcoidia bacterium]|nr:hypothetical protein [Dehalococcoidia bacterium]
MRKKLWGIIPLWTLAVLLVIVAAGTAWAAYKLTTRDIPVTVREPISVQPLTVENVTLYPGQYVDFTVINAAEITYGMQYACTLDNPDSGIEVKMLVDQDGPGADFEYVSYSSSKTVNIAPNGTQYLRVVCTEESAPASGVITVAFNRKAPSTT